MKELNARNFSLILVGGIAFGLGLVFAKDIAESMGWER